MLVQLCQGIGHMAMEILIILDVWKVMSVKSCSALTVTWDILHYVRWKDTLWGRTPFHDHPTSPFLSKFGGSIFIKTGVIWLLRILCKSYWVSVEKHISAIDLRSGAQIYAIAGLYDHYQTNEYWQTKFYFIAVVDNIFCVSKRL